MEDSRPFVDYRALLREMHEFFLGDTQFFGERYRALWQKI